MTVQELIDELNKVEDKNVKVFIVNPICGLDDISFSAFQKLKEYGLAEHDAFIIEGDYTYKDDFNFYQL
jgi:hypothetical protein